MKNKLTIIAEIVGIIGVLLALIFGINQWKSGNTSENTPQKIPENKPV